MNVSAWCIRNPIPSVLLFIMLSLGGLMGFKAMKVQVYTLTAAERQTFDAPAKKAREEYIAKASPAEKALYAQITKGITDYRATHK